MKENTRKQNIDSIIAILINVFDIRGAERIRQEDAMHTTLSTYSDAMLGWMFRHFDSRDFMTMSDRQLGYLLLTGRNESHFHAYVMMCDRLPRRAGSLATNVSGRIDSLRHYPQFAEKTENFHLVAQEDRDAMLMVLSVVSRIQTEFLESDGAPALINLAKGKAIPEAGIESVLVLPESTVDLLLERADEQHEITKVIVERGSSDRTLIESVLDAPARALSNGIL